jgi:hypothetical protein
MANGDENKNKNLGDSFNDYIPTATKLAQQFKSAVFDLEEKAVAVAKSFGQGRENIVNIKAGLADASDSLTKVGVSVTESLGKALEIQNAYTSTLGRSAMLTTETFGKLEAIYAVTKQSASEVIKGFADAGISAVNSGEEMQKVVNASRAIGVDTSKVSEMVVSNLSATSKFNFQGGVEGMAKMAAQAVNLRIDMNKILSISEDLFDPEKAIDMAAAMQRLGVSQSALLDPLRLMDMAQNDPAELQNQIAEMSKEFVRLNEKGQFEIMPGAKRQLIEVEKSLGLGRGELSKMALASAELEDKMSKIKMPDTFTDEQKQFIANMAQMGPGGEYKLKVDGKDMGLDQAIDLFKKDKDKFSQFMEASKPKSMEDLANEQLTVSKQMNNHLETISKAGTRAGRAIGATEATESLLTGALEITSKIPKVFGEGKFGVKEIREGVGESANEMFTKLSRGEVDEALKGVVSDTFGYIGDSFKQVMSSLKTATDEILTSSNKVINATMGGVGGLMEGGEKLIGIPLPGEKLIEQSQENLKKTTKETTEKSENLNKVMSTEFQQQTSKTEITYTGKIDLNVNAPAGMSESEWKSLTDKITSDTNFRQWLMTYINNPTGNKSPTEVNQSLNSVNR